MRIVDFKDTSGAVREKVWRLYEESFPAHERRSLTAQEQAFADCRARSKVMLDDEGEVMALVFYWLHAGMVYVEFLAVNPAMRGRNIGSGVVERLLELYPGKLVILEIEPPQEEMAVRRFIFTNGSDSFAIRTITSTLPTVKVPMPVRTNWCS